MAFQPLSVGDIVMLSQCAWKIGRAFVQKDAPAEFAKVEQEANNLSNALKLAADALHADDSILSRADEDTAQAVWAILESAQKSLNDLESFVDRYQVIKRREITGGYTVDRTWSAAIVANYRTIKWTTEGGNIQQLQDVLQMHTNTITLTMQALQTRSLDRLERTVMPMAENVAGIHEQIHGDLGNKIDDVHRVIMAIANSTPSLQARDRTIEGRDHRRQISDGTGSEASFSLDSPALIASAHSPSFRRSIDNRCDSAIVAPLRITRRDETRLLLPSPRIDAEASVSASWLDDLSDANAVLGAEGRDEVASRASMSVYTDSRPQSLAGSPMSTRRESLVTIREYRALADDPWSTEGGAVRVGSQQSVQTSPSRIETMLRSPRDQRSLPASDGQASRSPSRQIEHRDAVASSPRAPQRMPGREGPSAQSPPQASWDGTSPATTSPLTDYPDPLRVATPRKLLAASGAAQTPAQPLSPRSSSVSEAAQSNALFERSLFRNAAILCDVQGTLLEYARRNQDEADPRYDTEMVPVCRAARICVVRKRENREHGGTKLATSIWALSEDGKVRCQQKLPEHAETIPYGSFFSLEKVSLAGSHADDLVLRCHGPNWSDPLEKEIRTGWINYVFASSVEAAAFQSAVFGRTLISSLRTSKTTVIHDGIKGVFAFEEQFAKMDRLRMFKDDGTATSGAEGGVLALLHISSTFGHGWARFWLNSSRQQIHIKRDGERCVKLKGLQLTVLGSIPVTAGPARRASVLDEHLTRVDTARAPTRIVTGLRVEFETFQEREEFLALCKRLHERMLPLPPCC